MDIICTVDFKKCLCIEHYLRWVTFTFQRDITEVIVATRHSPNKTHSPLTQQDTLVTHPTPHPAKCEAMLFYRGSFIGPYPLITIGKEEISWVCHAINLHGRNFLQI